MPPFISILEIHTEKTPIRLRDTQVASTRASRRAKWRKSGSVRSFQVLPIKSLTPFTPDVELSRFRGPPPPYAEVIDIDSDAEIPPPVTIKSSPSKKQTIKIDFDDDADSDMEIELLPPASTSKAIEPPPPAALINEIKLSPEQQDVLLRVKSGRSVFFTGSAG